jgi:Ca2+-dependent lipid-binding protein
VTDEEGGDKNMKKSLFSRVFGGCIPWLATHEADGEKEETQSYEGRPNAIVIVKIEKCVHLPAMINNETSNAYVEIKSRGKRQKTQVIKESVDPIFEEKFDMDHHTNDEVRDLLLTVYHVKFGGGKQFLGKLHIDLTHAKMGDRSRGDKSLELKGMDGITPVICKSPADGKNVNSAIFMSWSISLKPEGLMSMRLSNGRNLIPPDQNGLGTPYVKIKFDDRVLKSHTAHDMAHPRWDQIISFDTLSFDQLYILPAHAKPSPKISIELWDCRALGDDVYIGGCEYDASKIRYETRSEMEWHRISDKTRARRSNVGEIKFSMAWGPNEPTILTVQIEEGFALTTHLQSSILGKKAKSFFSQSKEEENKKTLPSPFLRFQLDNTRKRKTRVIKETTAPKWDGVNNPH